MRPVPTPRGTTYAANQAASFTLTISGLGDTATGPGQGADPCGSNITANGTVTGAWAAGCQSAVSGRGFAQYYTFTTGEVRDITVTLDSTVDTFLYLRSGDRTGSVRAQNDDHGSLVNTAACSSPAGLDNTDSCITITGLEAGTYTIEATTYAANQAASTHPDHLRSGRQLGSESYRD